MANMKKPLTILTEEKRTFQSIPEMEAAFQTLKRSSVLPLFLLTRSQERGSSLTQTRVTSGLEKWSPKYRRDRIK
jgi:hypothetical protein